MKHPPLVGITAGNNPEQPEVYVLRWDYLRAIERAGGIPVVLAPSGPALHPALLDRLDGLMLTGGVDISPALYGEPPEHTVGRTSAERDEFETILLGEAFRRDLPVLAICRGMQMLNVARGGSLIQDIPTKTGSPLSHNDPDRRRDAVAHAVTILRGTALHAILERDEVEVNSFHHQAVKRLGAGLIVSAHASDGIIEGIELPAARFAVGVQWHPESFWRDWERFGRLFDSFLRAAADVTEHEKEEALQPA